jgi:puromycin-sensitive aminopeptidase
LSKPGPHRLSRSVVPSRYDLQVAPDFDQFAFTGSVRIQLEIVEPVDEIVLNAIELDITAVALSTVDGEAHGCFVEYETDLERAVIHLGRTVPVGAAVLNLDFTGILNDQLHGFYRSTFTDVDGQQQVIATTQFEATDARRAFPCWDEPDFKAVFGITLVVPQNLMAVSNSPEISRATACEGKVAISYADTIPMSTYLVAFVIGDFEATAAVDVDGVAVRVVAPRGKLHLTDYALECAVFCLRYFRSYYGIPYPGDKIDHLAIPDFAFGAMENLGCITYRETALLTDPDSATTAELIRILDVIAHELAHMWFGDLVTMRWWNGIWLNEAFASFMEMKAANAMRPEWKRWLQFAGGERPWAYGVDSLVGTRAVEFEVNSPSEANEMFDALTYGKGSAVLRMIEQYLGEETFRKGVGNYLRAHAYGNTDTSDLWTSLDQASGEPVGEIMDTWIFQGGYPLLEVTEDPQGLEICQRRHFKIPTEDHTRWQIPIQLRGSAGSTSFQAKRLLSDVSSTIGLDTPLDWVTANGGGHGFYRVGYSAPIQTKLLKRINQLDDLERFCLIDDAWALVESGDVSTPSYLRLATAYRNETEFVIWSAVMSGLGAMHHHLVGGYEQTAFGALVMELIEPTLDRLGWEPRAEESDLTRQLRALALGSAGRLVRHPSYVTRSQETFETWLFDPSQVDPEVAEACLFTVAALGDDAVYQRLFSLYENAESPQEKVRLLRSLTFVETEGSIDSTLQAVLDQRIRNQDSAWVVGWLFRRKNIGPYAWRKAQEVWDDIVASVPPMTVRFLIDSVLLSHPEVADEVMAFLSSANLPHAGKATIQALERLTAYVQLRERETAILAAHLGQV